MTDIVSGPILTVKALQPGARSVTANLLDQRHFGKPLRRHVEEFGAIFGIIFCSFGAWHGYHGKSWSLLLPLAGAGIIFPFLGYKAPSILYPLWKYWMKLAQLLGVVSTFLLLAICWLLILVPSAFLLRICGKKVMDLSFGKENDSYWEERKPEQQPFKKLEKQF